MIPKLILIASLCAIAFGSSAIVRQGAMVAAERISHLVSPPPPPPPASRCVSNEAVTGTTECATIK